MLSAIGPNQTVLTTSAGSSEAGNFQAISVLYSYNTPVAAVINGQAYRTETKWSATTSRHINAWLGHRAAAAITKPQSWFNSLITISAG